MHYTLIVTNNHLTNGRNALQVALDLLAQNNSIKQIYFLFDGAYVANKFIDMPTDEFALNQAWSDFAAQYKVPLYVCTASGLRRGISKDSIATHFNFGSIGEMLASCNASDRVLSLGRVDISLASCQKSLICEQRSAVYTMKSFLIIMEQNPYQNSLALEGLEFALALRSFDQPVSLLFKGEGVLQLLTQQEPDKLVGKDFTKIYTDLKLFGLEKIYIDQASMHAFAAEGLSVLPEIVNQEQIVQLLQEHDVVLTL